MERADAGLVVQPVRRVVLADHPEIAAVGIEGHAAVVAPAGAGRGAAVAALGAGAVDQCLLGLAECVHRIADQAARVLICGFVVAFDFV